MDNEIQEIEVALDALINAIITDDSTRPKRKPVLICAADLMNTPLPSRFEMDVKALVDTPVRAACRQGVRKLGP